VPENGKFSGLTNFIACHRLRLLRPAMLRSIARFLFDNRASHRVITILADSNRYFCGGREKFMLTAVFVLRVSNKSLYRARRVDKYKVRFIRRAAEIEIILLCGKLLSGGLDRRRTYGDAAVVCSKLSSRAAYVNS